MLNGETVLLTSAILFCIGFIGLFRQNDLVRVVISTEVMFFSSVLNFCYFSGSKAIKSGHFAALIAVILSGLVISVIYAVHTIQLKEDDSNLLSG